MLSYRGRFGSNVSLRASAYNNDFARAWYKTEAVDLDGSSSAQDFSGTNWFNLIQAINRGQDLNGFTPAELQAILDGSARYRHRCRPDSQQQSRILFPRHPG